MAPDYRTLWITSSNSPPTTFQVQKGEMPHGKSGGGFRRRLSGHSVDSIRCTDD